METTPLRMVRRKGLEPPTYWFVASHSIQLSYRRIPCLSRLSIIAQRGKNCKSLFHFFSRKIRALCSMAAGVGAPGAAKRVKRSLARTSRAK